MDLDKKKPLNMDKNRVPPPQLAVSGIPVNNLQNHPPARRRLKWGWWLAFYALVSPLAFLFIVPLVAQFLLMRTKRMRLKIQVYAIIGLNTILNAGMFFFSKAWWPWPDGTWDLKEGTNLISYLIYLVVIVFLHVAYTVLQSFLVYNAAKEYERSSLLTS